MTVDDFVAEFGDGRVRVLLDWSRVHGQCRAERSVVRSRELLGDLFTVWYVGPDRTPREFNAVDAWPLRVRDVPEPWRAEQIRPLRHEFARSGQAVHLLLPAYGLPDGGALLLDGTHRAVAAYQSGAPVVVELWTVHGPVDAAMLPDLRHHPAARTG